LTSAACGFANQTALAVEGFFREERSANQHHCSREAAIGRQRFGDPSLQETLFFWWELRSISFAALCRRIDFVEFHPERSGIPRSRRIC
jgi:hypothetical protein